MQNYADAGQPMRRDAALNAEKITVAATEIFAERGLEVSMADVAARAGVGVGTVYRRFGDKRGLIDALFTSKIAEVVDLAKYVAEQHDSSSSFLTFCLRCSELFAANKGLRQLMVSGDVKPTESSAAALAQLIPAVTSMVNDGKRDGWLRESFTATDFPVVMVAIQSVRDFGGTDHPDLWRRMAQMVFYGVTAPSVAALDTSSPPPLTPDQIRVLMREE